MRNANYVMLTRSNRRRPCGVPRADFPMDESGTGAMAEKRTALRKLNPVSPQVMKLATLLRRSASSSYKRAFGFANGEWRLIGLLGENGPMLQNALVEALGQDKGQTSRGVARLVEGNLIVRARTPGGVLIRLSPCGQVIFGSMRELIRE